MSQPVWKIVYHTDYSTLLVDKTGVYAPELEIYQEYDADGETRFQVYRVVLDRCKVARPDDDPLAEGYLVPFAYQPDWPYPLPSYQKWYAKDLASVASSHGTTESELIKAICSDDPKDLAWAYECIGGHHGFDNLDSYPLDLSEEEFEARCERFTLL